MGCEPTIVGPNDFNPGSYLNHAANEFGPVSEKRLEGTGKAGPCECGPRGIKLERSDISSWNLFTCEMLRKTNGHCD